jgi:hypothetical protein
MQSVMLAILALYGTYTVGNDGQFFQSMVEGYPASQIGTAFRGREQPA